MEGQPAGDDRSERLSRLVVWAWVWAHLTMAAVVATLIAMAWLPKGHGVLAGVVNAFRNVGWLIAAAAAAGVLWCMVLMHRLSRQIMDDPTGDDGKCRGRR
ncbi:MAG: hypothetical protein FJX75_29780 [Armatimonadetes bacterium]|nr:hypothetical protein [Armatimonadota bacterium]